MSKKNSITIDGVTYESVVDASRKLGVSRSRLRRRICSKSLNDLYKDLRSRSNARKIIIDRIEYPSIIEASRKLGINYFLLVNRIHRGYLGNLSDKPSPRNKSITINGVIYESISEAERSLGYNIGVIHKRIISGSIPLDNPIMDRRQVGIMSSKSRRNQKLKSLMFT